MEKNWEVEYNKAAEQLRDVREDLRIANAKLEGDPCTIGIHREMKIDRQRAALNRLQRNRRIARLQLRWLNENGRGMTADEYNQFKEDHKAELAEIYDSELVS
jgi:hypothetical protein